MKRFSRFSAISLALIAIAALATPAAAATGPQLVKNINTNGDSDPRGLTAFDGKIYFSAKGGGLGRELWSSDGTSQGTRRVKDIWPGSEGSRPTALTVFGRQAVLQR